MTASNDLDRLVASWLESDGPTNVRMEVVDKALDTARGMRQRRGPSAWFAGPGSWPVYAGRLSLRGLSPAVRLGIAIAVMLALIVGSVTVGSRLLQDADPITPSTHYNGTFESVGRSIGDTEDPPGPVVVLPDGRVFAMTTTRSADGSRWAPTRIEAWDPSTGTISDLGSTLKPRAGATVIALRDGRVLIVGGDLTPLELEECCIDSATAEVFDPATGTSTPTGPKPGADLGFAATLLPDGRVLVAGGTAAQDHIARTEDSPPLTELATAEIYDPATNSWISIEPMTKGAAGLQMMRLPDGRILLVQSWNSDGATANIESFDPATGSFSSVGELAQPPAAPGVLLADGRVLFAHGSCFIYFPPDHPGGATTGIEPVSTEIFDPADGSLTAGPALPHCVETATALPDGSVLVTGAWGEGGPWQYEASSDSFRMPDQTTVSWAGLLDPRSGSVRMVDPPGRSGAIPTVLASGDVLFVGGTPSDNTYRVVPSAPLIRDFPKPALTWGEIFR
jgi:hypothetical protein